MSANDRQVGGDHYSKIAGEQHWDRVARMNLNYFQGCATAYIERCLDKGHAIEDLEKAIHFCQKLIDLIEGGTVVPRNPKDVHYPKATVKVPVEKHGVTAEDLFSALAKGNLK